MVDFDPSGALPQAGGDPRRFDDLIARARAAGTVKEECAVIRDVILASGLSRDDDNDLCDIVLDVARGAYPRAVLLGVVAALVPDGLSFFASCSFSADHNCAIAKAGAKDAQSRDLPWIRHESAALALLIAIMEASK